MVIENKNVILKNARKIVENCNRFDLIFKVLYLYNHVKFREYTSFFERLYLAHIKAFNNFYEEIPRKSSGEDFLNHFNRNLNAIKEHGFNPAQSTISLDSRGHLTDGAHRLAICAYLNREISAVVDDIEANYDYKFFLDQGLCTNYSDLAALEFVKYSSNAYIVNIHSIVPVYLDKEVENILFSHGSIYYKKTFYLSYNGYVNFKKMTYGFDDDSESWIGNYQNDFEGAKHHAMRSMGAWPVRVYVFISQSLDNVIKAKEEIRKLCNVGNFSVHVNDYKEEAIRLSQTFFNKNSLKVLNLRPYNLNTSQLDHRIEKLKKIASDQGVSVEDVCGVGSTPMNIFGLRSSRDLDFIHIPEKFNNQTGDISSHESELEYYPANKYDLIYDPENHFYYRGLKFSSLNVVRKMKMRRHEFTKDYKDLWLIFTFEFNAFRTLDTKFFLRDLKNYIKQMKRKIIIKISKLGVVK